MDNLRVFLVIIASLISIQALAISYKVIEYEDPDVQDWALNRKHGVVLARYYDEIHVYGQGTDLELLSLQIEGRTIDAQYDGDLFGVLRNDGTIEVYTLLGLELVVSFENPDAHKIRFSECNTYLHAVLPSQQLIVRYDLETGLREDKAVTGLVPFDLASWDGDLMAVQGEPDGDDTILKVNLYRSWGDDQKEELGSTNRMPPAANGRTLQFFDGGNRLFVGRGTTRTMVFDVQGEDDITIYIGNPNFASMATFGGLSGDEQHLLFNRANNFSYWVLDLESRQVEHDPRWNYSTRHTREWFFVGDEDKLILHHPRHFLRMVESDSDGSQQAKQMRHVPSQDFEIHPDGDHILSGVNPTLFSFPSLQHVEGKDFHIMDFNQFGFYDADTAFIRHRRSINLFSLDDPTTPIRTFTFGPEESLPVMTEASLEVSFHPEINLLSFYRSAGYVSWDLKPFWGVGSLNQMKDTRSSITDHPIIHAKPDTDHDKHLYCRSRTFRRNQLIAKGFNRDRDQKFFLMYDSHVECFMIATTETTIILETHDVKSGEIRRDDVLESLHHSYPSVIAHGTPISLFYSFGLYRPNMGDFLFATYREERGTGLDIYRLDPETLDLELLRDRSSAVITRSQVLYHEDSELYFSDQDHEVTVFDSQMHRVRGLLPGISLSNIRLTPDGRHLVASAPNRFYIVDLNQPDLHVRLTLDRLLGRRLHLPPDRNRDGAIDAADLFHTLE